ncbi:MAG: Eco57I restriction-modification methylase domain-containing protein [Parabacteroides sp.]|jgi:site-specific DNA-methyltransferase (adenine-specific)|nr:Eco57I restriction-modification methylase domain-containing protein [Parabacteroides sp.]
MSDFYTNTYNPDVLSCLANLSNDEVFTPPNIVNKMLDMLPQELFSNKTTTFLDPACKSGVFLREIAKRLLVGLEAEIPDLQERIDHIFHKQLYGIAITEMTSLLSRRSVYCSKFPNGRYSITKFDDAEGNIRFKKIQHVWRGEKCAFCGASKGEYDRDDALETHAYEFIHTTKPEGVLNMKFDVIIGNPPYQLSDEGFGRSASPIYHMFVKQAKKLRPRFLSMIIPARWFTGGKGLDNFRDELLHDNRLSKIHDFPDATDVFPGVQIKGGVCFFLWDRDQESDCEITTHRGSDIVSVMTRPLLDFGADTFIRYNEAISIVEKVRAFNEPSIIDMVSSRKPFGFPTNYLANQNPTNNSVKLYQNGGYGYIPDNEITQNKEIVDKYKVFIPPLGSGSDSFPHPILGRPFLGEPRTACTETYLFIGSFDSEVEPINLISYITTRFFRFLVLLNKPSQHATKKVYHFVPIQDFFEPWTDEKLYAKYGITEEEQAFIESMIRPMELGGDNDE